MAQPSQDELRRRLKAARALRALTVPDLAARIPGESRLGERTLRKLESGEQTLLPPVLRELAVALDVPYEWFTGPDPAKVVAHSDVPAGLDGRLDRMQEILDYLSHWQEGEVLQRIVEYRTEAYGRLLERLEQIDKRLDRIEPSLTEDLTQLRRRWAQTLGQPASADQATPAAGEPHDGDDATQEAAAPRARGKRAGGERPGR